LYAAEVSAGFTEFIGFAEAASRVGVATLVPHFIEWAFGGVGCGLYSGSEAVGLEGAGQKIVDGDVVGDGLAGKARDEPGEAATRAVGEAENIDGSFDSSGGDVDYAAESALDHAIDGGLYELDGGEHIGVERRDPDLSVPLAEIARWWAAGIVDEDVGSWASGESGSAPFVGCDVGGDGYYGYAGSLANLIGSRFDGFGRAGHDRHIHALTRQRQGACLAETFTGRANQGVSSCYFQVHNVMMRCLLLLLPFLAYGENLTGLWDATVITDGVHVPFRMKLSQKGTNAQGTLYDGNIEYKSDSGKFEGGKLHLHWNITNADLDATLEGSELKGKYVTIRSHTKRLVKDVIAKRSALAMENAKALSIAGRWTLKSDDNDPKKVWAITIQQHGAEIAGAIERLDGDSGTMTGTIHDHKLVLSHFSGIRPTVLTGDLMPDGSLKLVFNEKQSMTGLREDAAIASGVKPIDPTQFTKVKNPDEPFPFAFQDVEGKMVSNIDERFKGKVVLVNITGSWCPNCNDDAPVLDALYKKYKAAGLEVVGLSFESGDLDYDRDRVKAFIARNHVTYPILIAGTVDNIATQLPFVVNFGGYPTTFFLDRTGKVALIHDGFSGPGTGVEYERLKAEIEAEVKKLLGTKSKS